MTPIPPEEISTRTLSKRRNRYDAAQIESFVDEVARSYREVWEERGRLQEKTSALEADLARYGGLERRLSDALLLAETAAADLRERAEREAEDIVSEAHRRADEIVSAARGQHEALQVDVERLEQLRSELARSFRALLLSGLEVLESHDAGNGDAPAGDGHVASGEALAEPRPG